MNDLSTGCSEGTHIPSSRSGTYALGFLSLGLEFPEDFAAAHPCTQSGMWVCRARQISPNVLRLVSGIWVCRSFSSDFTISSDWYVGTPCQLRQFLLKSFKYVKKKIFQKSFDSFSILSTVFDFIFRLRLLGLQSRWFQKVMGMSSETCCLRCLLKMSAKPLVRRLASGTRPPRLLQLSTACPK